jgi:hypothetical protein
MKLGRLPHAPERLARGLMSAPAPMLYRYQLDRGAIDPQPQMWGNADGPTCTVAGLANGAIAQGIIRSAPPVIGDGKPQALYAIVDGIPGATEEQINATDGLVVMDLLDYVSTNGFDAGEQVPLVPVQRFVVHNAREAIAGCMCNERIVTAYLGIRLYQRDMDTMGAGPLVAPIADSGEMVGGHALLAWDYPKGLGDADLVTLLTWAARQPVSWKWLLERLDETHAIEWPQLAAAPVIS